MVAATVSWVKGSPPADPELPVRVAGEPEAASRAARIAAGIPVDGAIWEELRAAAVSVGATLDG